VRALAFLLVIAGLVQADEPTPKEKTPGKKGFIGATVRVNIENNDVTGILLLDIVKDGPADKAGLMVNDLVVKIDDTPIKDLNKFKDVVLNHKPGDAVIVYFTRDGKEAEFRLTIGERPEP
jgi:S1-C subfamily serine protease